MGNNEQIVKDFQSDYWKYMLDKNANKDPGYFNGGLHASTIGYCKRRSVYEYYGFEQKEYPLTTLTTFARGNNVHNEVQDMFKSAEHFKVLHIELDVSDGMPDNVKGKLDCIVEHNGVKILIDLKSANPQMFKAYMKTLPKPDHMHQVTHYANACDVLKIPYDKLAIIYLDKGGTNRSQMYFFDKQPEANTLMANDLKAIENYDKNKIIPPYDLDSKSEWKCSYCPYFQVVCWGKESKQ